MAHLNQRPKENIVVMANRVLLASLARFSLPGVSPRLPEVYGACSPIWLQTPLQRTFELPLLLLVECSLASEFYEGSGIQLFASTFRLTRAMR